MTPLSKTPKRFRTIEMCSAPLETIWTQKFLIMFVYEISGFDSFVERRVLMPHSKIQTQQFNTFWCLCRLFNRSNKIFFFFFFFKWVPKIVIHRSGECKKLKWMRSGNYAEGKLFSFLICTRQKCGRIMSGPLWSCGSRSFRAFKMKEILWKLIVYSTHSMKKKVI